MTSKTREQKATRLLQEFTGWTYGECLRCVRDGDAGKIEALAMMRGQAIDTKHPKYELWRKHMAARNPGSAGGD